jgi:hypothetical protein
MAQRMKPSAGKSAKPTSTPEFEIHTERLQGMCCHGLISEELAQDIVASIQSGQQSVEEAIQKLQEECTCGLFLPSRARRILNAALSSVS